MLKEILLEDTLLSRRPQEKVSQVVEKILWACDTRTKSHFLVEFRNRNKLENCLNVKRSSQCWKNWPDFEGPHIQYKNARTKLQVAITKGKSKNSKRMWTNADFDPWGGAYKSMMSSLKGKRSPPVSKHFVPRRCELYECSCSTCNPRRSSYSRRWGNSWCRKKKIHWK